jgi:hypothetical protein
MDHSGRKGEQPYVRASRVRRTRVGSAVAGSALAVVLVAAVVPAIQRTASSQPAVPRGATQAPTTARSPSAATSYALDPDQPWAYRGIPLEELGGADAVDTMRSEYAVERGVPESSVTLTPLFGQVDEPSGRHELVFLADVDGERRWGVIQGGEHGPADELLWDEPLPSPARALASALPGDPAPRLLVVAAPEARGLEYALSDTTPYRAMAALAEGVGITALDGHEASDSFRVLDPQGNQIVRADAPDPPPPPVQEPPPDPPLP